MERGTEERMRGRREEEREQDRAMRAGEDILLTHRNNSELFLRKHAVLSPSGKWNLPLNWAVFINIVSELRICYNVFSTDL